MRSSVPGNSSTRERSALEGTVESVPDLHLLIKWNHLNDIELASSLLLVVAALMLVVGVVAALGPARRSLRVQASEALRTDA
jgi:ABC-type lipoprotein release transport system permease subunit